MAKRFDTGALTSSSATPQGGIKAAGRFTRSGIFTYRYADGRESRELRPPEEVFSPASLATLAHAPVTDDHPPDAVTPVNWRQVVIGHVDPAIAAAPPYVEGSVVIQDAGAMSRISTGELKEFSCGYDCRIDATPGTYEGQPYDAVQRDIKYNHLAMGGEGWGRAGRDVALRTDSCAVMTSDMADDFITGMSTADELVRTRCERDVANGRADAAEKRADAAERALAEAKDPKSLATKVTERVRLIGMCSAAAKASGVRFDADEAAAAPEGDMMSALLKEIAPDLDITGKSPEYIQGVFYATVKALIKSASAEETPASVREPPAEVAPPGMSEALDAVHAARLGTVREDAEDSPYDSRAAMQRNAKRLRDAWKQPLRNSTEGQR